MPQGFYDQIGVGPDADADEIRVAYTSAVAHLIRRREATVGAGGDTSALDLARAQLDEAWDILSNPAKRRRYDAMLAVVGDGVHLEDPGTLWPQVQAAMIPPDLAEAARYVDAATALRLGPIAAPPRPARGGGATPPPQAARTPAFGPRRGSGRVSADRIPVASAQVARQDPASAASVEPPTGVSPMVRAAAAAPSPPREPAVDPSAGASPAPSQAKSGAPAAAAAARAPQPVDPFAHLAGGDLLRASREAKGLSVADLSEETRISARYIDALEREDFSVLPTSGVYVRGYISVVARALGLDPARAEDDILRRMRAES